MTERKHNRCGTCKHWEVRWTVPDRKISAVLTERGGDLGYCGFDHYDLRLPFWMTDMARVIDAPVTGPEAGMGCQLWEPQSDDD
jgi:hypothetical protein